MADKKIKIGITHGDINGISYEIILKALSDNRICELCTPIVYGSNKVAGFYKRDLKELQQFSFNIIQSASDAGSKRPNLINCIDDNVKIEPGTSTLLAGQYALASLNSAIKDLKENKIDAVVTCPINKANIHSSEFQFIGHTEYMSAQFGDETSLMFMISDDLKIGLVTNHEPISRVASLITPERILHKLRLMKQSLQRDFTVRQPKIAVLSLNPHNGDDGLLGNEEQEIIIPALNSARYEGIMAFGPFAADGFFGKELYRKFDAVLAMYHDQGMVPFKALTGNDGVNFTAGLTAVRTSPAHGVGYDITGKGIANEGSLRAAIYAAIDICRNRSINEEAAASPLPSYSKESWGKDISASDIKAPEEESVL